jgi:hypothetical protein
MISKCRWSINPSTALVLDGLQICRLAASSPLRLSHEEMGSPQVKLSHETSAVAVLIVNSHRKAPRQATANKSLTVKPVFRTAGRTPT